MHPQNYLGTYDPSCCYNKLGNVLLTNRELLIN